MLPEKPCEKCNHKKVCEATKKFDEINISITHPFFKAKIECSEFQPRQDVFVKKSDNVFKTEVES